MYLGIEVAKVGQVRGGKGRLGLGWRLGGLGGRGGVAAWRCGGWVRYFSFFFVMLRSEGGGWMGWGMGMGGGGIRTLGQAWVRGGREKGILLSGDLAQCICCAEIETGRGDWGEGCFDPSIGSS